MWRRPTKAQHKQPAALPSSPPDSVILISSPPSSPESLGQAWREQRRLLKTDANAGQGRAKEVKAAPSSSPAKRKSKRRDDETLITGRDFTPQSRRKRVPPVEPGQTTLSKQGGLLRPSAQQQSAVNGRQSTATSKRVKIEANRNAKVTRLTIKSPKKQAATSKRAVPRSPLGRNASSGLSAADPILFIDDSDTESAVSRRSRPPPSRSTTRTPSGYSTTGKRGRLDHCFPDDSADTTLAQRAAEALAPRCIRSQSRVLVPETLQRTPDSSASNYSTAEEDMETPSPKRHRSEQSPNPFFVPETPPLTSGSTSRAGTPVTSTRNGHRVSRSPLEQKSALERRSVNVETPMAKVKPPQTALRSPPTSEEFDALAGLARSPTPKKAVPFKSGVPPAALRRKRALDLLGGQDDESWRPSPQARAALARKHQTPQNAAASRPQRVQSAPGKYKLPEVDTPIHLWPTKPAAQPKAASARRDNVSHSRPRTLPRSKLAVSPATPIQKSRSRAPSSPLTPLPQTQLPRHGTSSNAKVNKTTPLKQVASSAGRNRTPSPKPVKGGSKEESNAKSGHETDTAESEFDFAEFAEFNCTPTSSVHEHGTPSRTPSVRSVGMGRSTSPSGRSVGKRLSLSPLARFKSLPSISEQDGSPSRSVAKPCQLLISPELPASNGQLGPRPPEESTVDKLLREQEQERAQEEELARRTRQQVQERIERLTAEQLKQVHVQDEDDAEAEAEAENTDLLRALHAKRRTPSRPKAQGLAVNSSIYDKSPKDLGSSTRAGFKHLMQEHKRDAFNRSFMKANNSRPPEPRQLKAASPTDDLDVDLEHFADMDEDVFAEVEAACAGRSMEQSQQPAERNWAFWTGEETHPGDAITHEQVDMAEVLELLNETPSPTANTRLFYQMFSVPNERYAVIIHQHLLRHLSDHSFDCSGGSVQQMAISVWRSLGAKVSCSEKDLPTVVRDRNMASSFLCRVISALGRQFTDEEALTLVQHLILLLADSSTSAALASDIATTLEEMIPHLYLETLESEEPFCEDFIGMVSKLAPVLGSLSKATQSYVVLSLGQRFGMVRETARWIALLLLLPDCGAYVKQHKAPPVSLLNQILRELHTALTDPAKAYDLNDLSSDLALWSVAASDIPMMMEEISLPDNPHPSVLSEALLLFRNRILDSDGDGRTSDTKTRLNQMSQIIRWKSQREAKLKEKKRLEGTNLEQGVGGQTRLSFGGGRAVGEGGGEGAEGQL